jgi:AcrR family transcriptional regulator
MGQEAAEFPAGASPARSPGGGRARGDTRERIQSVALELFAEHGYQQISLREIAERLGVTKAALYYHFKSKEDIVRSFTEDYVAELDALLIWGADQPRTPATRAELLARYSDIVQQRLGVLRFLEQNQAAVHHLMTENGDRDNKRMFREQFESFRDLLAPPGSPLEERVRASVAVVSIGLGSLLFQKEAADPAELREIVLGIATELAGATPKPSLSPTATA